MRVYPSWNVSEEYREIYDELKKSDLLTGRSYSMKENFLDLLRAPSMDDAIKY